MLVLLSYFTQKLKYYLLNRFWVFVEIWLFFESVKRCIANYSLYKLVLYWYACIHIHFIFADYRQQGDWHRRLQVGLHNERQPNAWI